MFVSVQHLVLVLLRWIKGELGHLRPEVQEKCVEVRSKLVQDLVQPMPSRWKLVSTSPWPWWDGPKGKETTYILKYMENVLKQGPNWSKIWSSTCQADGKWLVLCLGLAEMDNMGNDATYFLKSMQNGLKQGPHWSKIGSSTWQADGEMVSTLPWSCWAGPKRGKATYTLKSMRNVLKQGPHLSKIWSSTCQADGKMVSTLLWSCWAGPKGKEETYALKSMKIVMKQSSN